MYERYVAIYQQRKAVGAAAEVSDRYVNSFPRFERPELVARTFALIDAGIFPFQSIASIMSQLMYQPATQVAAWAWLKAHWAYLEQQAQGILPFVVRVTGQLPASLRDDITSFLTEHLHGELASSQAQALEQIDQTAELKARTRDGLLAWFRR